MCERPWQPCSWQNADLSAIFTQIRQFVTCNELCEVTARQIRRRSQQSSSNGTAPGEQAQLSEQLSSRGARGGMGRRFGSAGPENDARAAVRQHSSARSALEAQNCSGGVQLGMAVGQVVQQPWRADRPPGPSVDGPGGMVQRSGSAQSRRKSMQNVRAALILTSVNNYIEPRAAIVRREGGVRTLCWSS